MYLRTYREGEKETEKIKITKVSIASLSSRRWADRLMRISLAGHVGYAMNVRGSDPLAEATVM